MSKKIPVIIIALLCFQKIQAQTELNLLNVGGGSTGKENFYFDYTVGEVSCPKLNAGITVVGFLQPYIKLQSSARTQEIKIYEFVSANNDGKNETFFISNIKAYPENELVIFNKEGITVYQQKNYDNSWAGQNLPEDAYFYIFRTSNPVNEFKGGLVLTR